MILYCEKWVKLGKRSPGGGMEDQLPENRPARAKTIPRKPAWLECQIRKVENERVKVGGVGALQTCNRFGICLCNTKEMNILQWSHLYRQHLKV